MTQVTDGRDPRVRNLVAVGAGVVVGVIVMVVLQSLNAMLFPPPPGTDPADLASMQRAMAAMSVPAFLGLIVGYFVATTVGCYVAARLAATNPTLRAQLVGGAFIVAGVMNFRSLPHPAWVVMGANLGFLLGIVVGLALARRRRST